MPIFRIIGYNSPRDVITTLVVVNRSDRMELAAGNEGQQNSRIDANTILVPPSASPIKMQHLSLTTFRWIHNPALDLIVGCGAWSLPLILLGYSSLSNSPAWAIGWDVKC